MTKRAFLPIILFWASINLSAQNEVLSNKSILDMIELGFTEDVIIAKINVSTCTFDTSISELKLLKDKGVSSDIIVSMIQSNNRDSKKTKDVSGEALGIYFKENGEYKKIFPVAFSGTKTNTLGSAISPNITNTKIKSVITNSHSDNIVNTNIPEFRFYFNSDKQEKAEEKGERWFSALSSPYEFALVKLASKKNKRELNTGEFDLYSGHFIGIENKDVVKCNIEAISESEFRVIPQAPMLPNEYCFFYQGAKIHDDISNQAVFDFSIPETCKIENKYTVDDSVWVLKEKEPRKLEVMSVYIKKDGIYYSLRGFNSWKGEEYKEADCFPSKEDALKAMY